MYGLGPRADRVGQPDRGVPLEPRDLLPGAAAGRQRGGIRTSLRDRRLDAAKRPGILHGIDAELAVLVCAERQRVSAHRVGKRRAQPRDTAHARRQIGHLRDAAFGGADAVDIADPGAVGDEQQVAAACPLRADVLARRRTLDEPHIARRQVQPRDLEVPERERPRLGTETIGHERNRLPVGRPRRLEIGKDIVGQPAGARRPEIVDEQVCPAPLQPGEHDRLPVGRPGRAVDLADGWERDLLLGDARDRVEDRQAGLAALNDRKREVPAVGRPGPGGVDGLEAAEVRIERGVHDLAENPARVRVGEEQVERQHVALREEHQQTAVRAQRRRHVVGGQFVPPLLEHAAVVARTPRSRLDRCGRLAQRLVPLLREFGRFQPEVDVQRDVGVARRARRAEQRAHRRIAPSPDDIGPQRLPPAVREVLRVRQVPNRRQLRLARGVAHPHRGVGVDCANRQELRHALDEPERKAVDSPIGDRHRVRVIGADVVLKGVDQLVANRRGPSRPESPTAAARCGAGTTPSRHRSLRQSRLR